MEELDMRNMLLSELIDKMHSRLADKLYPPSSAVPMPDVDQSDKPAAADIPGTEAEKDEKKIDVDNDNEPTDDEIEALINQ